MTTPRPEPSANQLGLALDQHIARLGKELANRANDIMRLHADRTAHLALIAEQTEALQSVKEYLENGVDKRNTKKIIDKALAKSRKVLGETK